jgi:D-alanine-D-alanine ligase
MRPVWQREAEQVLDELIDALGLPVFVKPANLGSSVGISKADSRAELADALALAAAYDRKLVIEVAVPNAREIEVSVLGNDEPIASVPGEIVPGDVFYSYADKYLDGNSQALIPAPLEEELLSRIQKMALDAFRAVEGSGLARVDFLLDDVSGALFLNEINTMPGFTRISMYPKLWEASGVSYPELVDRLLQLGLERHADRQQNRTTLN